MKTKKNTMLYVLFSLFLLAAITWWLNNRGVKPEGITETVEKRQGEVEVVEGFEHYVFNTPQPATELPIEEEPFETQQGENDVQLVITTTPAAQIQNVVVPEGLLFGVYDPVGEHDNNPFLDMEQAYVSWLDYPEVTHGLVNAILAKGRVPFISIEPYPWEGTEFTIEWIVEGLYDPHITGHCSALNISGQTVYVRWAHEMEIGAFPWGLQDAGSMVQAFQRFSSLCREAAPNVQIVWSPAGHQNLDDYWPGADYVDAIGLTSLSNQLINGRATAERAFGDLFGGRYNLVSGYGKPVIISEFGAAGSSEYVETYFKEAYAQFGDYPLLKAVILFNLYQQDEAWGEGVYPDFRVGPETFPPRY